VRLGGILLWYRGIPRRLTGVEVVFGSRVFRRGEGRDGVRKGEGVRTGEFKSGTSTTLNPKDQDLQTRTTRMKRPQNLPAPLTHPVRAIWRRNIVTGLRSVKIIAKEYANFENRYIRRYRLIQFNQPMRCACTEHIYFQCCAFMFYIHSSPFLYRSSSHTFLLSILPNCVISNLVKRWWKKRNLRTRGKATLRLRSKDNQMRKPPVLKARHKSFQKAV
jgi:hypothetical protein